MFRSHRLLVAFAWISLCFSACSSGGDCPEGIWFDGECLSSDCPDRKCPAGSVCAAGSCMQEVCLGVECQDGQACADGQCHPKNCTARNCPGVGEVCLNEECVPAVCVEVSCPPGQRCADGACRPIDCSAQTCPGPGDVCVGEECVERTCLGVTCPPGQACAGGYCYPRDCPEKSCSAEGMLCAADECRDPRCVGVVCRGGQVCHDGWCQQSGCGGYTCPDGCCDGGSCRQSSFSTCGIGGIDCVDCAVYAQRADACSAGGVCVCTATGVACAGGQVCTASECCTPESDGLFCSRLGYECDPATNTDNCGATRTADCGTCPAPDVCVDNRCGCDPLTCAEAGAECDWIADGCGSLTYCGNCTPPETCNTGTNTCECASHVSWDCYLDDVYWFDSCGDPEGVMEFCDYKCEDGACVECVQCTHLELSCLEPADTCISSECLSECRYNNDTSNGNLCTEWYLADDCGARGLCCGPTSCVICR